MDGKDTEPEKAVTDPVTTSSTSPPAEAQQTPAGAQQSPEEAQQKPAEVQQQNPVAAQQKTAEAEQKTKRNEAQQNSAPTEKEPLIETAKVPNEIEAKPTKTKKKKNIGKSIANFLYNPQRKTVLGRSSLNWAKLATFYSVFYFCLGCFFVGLLYIFALLLDREIPRYYDTQSTMAVRTTATVVGMGFRPQPIIDDNLIRVTDDPDEQQHIAASLKLFRDVYLTQSTDARIEECSENEPASTLPQGTACSFNWNQIVNSDNHPCSDSNLYGFKKEQPCILVKLNKVYGWTPRTGHMPHHIQQLRGVYTNKTVSNSNVFITCEGANVADKDFALDMTYYSYNDAVGSSKYGTIPYYFFPYRNARDHVQPFVFVQFKKLPLNRLISITCKAWAPNIEHDTRAMRGMVTFQLYRTHKNIGANDK